MLASAPSPAPALPGRQEGTDRQELEGRAAFPCGFFPGLFLARGSTREEPLASGGDRTERGGGGWVSLRETRKTWVSPRGWPAWVFSGAPQRSPAGKGNLPCAPTVGHVQLGLSGLLRVFKVPEKPGPSGLFQDCSKFTYLEINSLCARSSVEPDSPSLGINYVVVSRQPASQDMTFTGACNLWRRNHHSSMSLM